MREYYSQAEKQPEKIRVENRGAATVKILETFKRAQKENYGTLDYHNEKHPERVRKAALEFAKIIMRIDPTLVTKDTLAEIVNSAASHDSVLNFAHGERITRFRGFFDTDIPEKIRPLMQQAGVTGGNERLSADWLGQELDRYVGEEGQPVFEAQSRAEMASTIAATFPEYDFTATISDEDFEKYFNEDKMREAGLEKYRTGIKIWQPHLKAVSSITTLALATGDLRGEVSSTNFKDFLQSGNAEFRELTEGFRLAIAHGVGTISPEKRKEYAEDMLKWVKSQITFGMWQKILFWESVDKNLLIAQSQKSAEIKRALQDHYDPNFDTNILKSKERYERLAEKHGEGETRKERLARMTDASFQELIEELGFSLIISKTNSR